MNDIWNRIFLYIVTTPLALAHLLCFLGSSIAVLATLSHVRRARRLYKYLDGPVPKIHETAALRKFDAGRQRLADKSENAGALALVAAGFGFIIFLFLVWVPDTISWPHMIALCTPFAVAFFVYVFQGDECHQKIARAMLSRPTLGCLRYLPYLPKGDKPGVERVFRGSLDDHACVLEVNAGDAQMRADAVPDAAELSVRSDALWAASHDELPLVDDIVLVVWRDGSKWHRVKTMLGKVTAVAAPDSRTTTEELMKPGRTIITVLGESFCGGKIAHFNGSPNNRIDRGWIATADRAHILLASLVWLDNDQREFCYQLVNPGKAYPYADALNRKTDE